MSKNIYFGLSESSIDRAIKELQEYKTEFDKKCKVFRHAVAERVKQYADAEYANTWYNDLVIGGKQSVYIPTYVEETDEASIVVAEGLAAVFIEFGAGIHHNGGKGMLWRSPHPWGMELKATIGSFPDRALIPSQGQYDTWGGIGRKGSSGVGSTPETYGTQAQMPLYKAWNYAMADIEDIAKEIFNK